MKRPQQPQPLTITEAIIPVASPVVLVGLSFYLFGDLDHLEEPYRA